MATPADQQTQQRTDEDYIDLTDERDGARHDEPGDRGRQADKPSDVPKEGWKDIALRVKGEVKTDHVPLLSAGVAFYLLLALFPALIAMVSIYGLVADPDQVEEQVTNATDALPESARNLLVDQLEGIVQSAGGGIGLALIGGVLAALWSASSGMKHLVTATNVAYDEEESRGFLKLRGLAIALTLGAVVFGAVAIGVLAVLPVVLDNIGLGRAGELAVRIGSYPALAILFALGLAVLYRYAPDRDQPRWRWTSWGAVIATVVWIVASLGFSFYVSNFGSFDETYGTIGAFIVLMLWLVITAFSIMLGAEIDSELEAQTDKDSTVGEPQPKGQRDAVKADNTAPAVAADDGDR